MSVNKSIDTDVLATASLAYGSPVISDVRPHKHLKMARQRKYEPVKLVAMFRLAAALRNQMLEAGFTDNGGAIHSSERILNILGLRLCYPELTHINNLRNHPGAPFSQEALIAHRAGEKVLIEHVSPHRALTRLAITQVDAGLSDEDFVSFVKANFQLALLTEAETSRLNRINRSQIASDRLTSAGIVLAIHSVPVRANPSCMDSPANARV